VPPAFESLRRKILRTGRRQLVRGGRAPAPHHRITHFRMELDAIRARPVADGLVLEVLAGREDLEPGNALEALAMPLVDVRRPRPEPPADGRRGDRPIADFRAPVAMRGDAAAQVTNHHLRTEAHAEKGHRLTQRHADPVDFILNPAIAVVGAHRAAEHHGPRMVGQRGRQRIAEGRAANVERMAASGQQPADPARARLFAMQDDQDRTKGSVRHVVSEGS